MDFYPIPVGQGNFGYEHCRYIDDNIYDIMSKDFDRVLWRKGSHVCLKMN